MVVIKKEIPDVILDAHLKIDQCAILIQTIGTELGCDVSTVAKAMLFCHKFKIAVGDNDRVFDQQSLAVSCLCLSSQMSSGTVIDVSKKTLYKLYRIEKTERESMKPFVKKTQAYMLELQYLLTQLLNYNFYTFETAHKYVCQYLECLKSMPQLQPVFWPISNQVSRLLSTYYLCKKPLFYEPEAIALAAIQMALQHAAVDPETVKCFSKECDALAENEGSTNVIIGDIIDDMTLVSDVSTALV